MRGALTGECSCGAILLNRLDRLLQTTTSRGDFRAASSIALTTLSADLLRQVAICELESF
jgi:hypothetical protein